ncbi:MAG: hypothetical protein GY838_14250 [bacterium]|nr:hypothetical protein [bacterium]
MEYEIHQRSGFVEVVTHGDGEAKVFQELLSEVLARPEWKPGVPVLIDHSDFNAGPLTVGEMSALADMIGNVRVELGSSRMAILVVRDLEFGLGRMWLAFVEDKWSGTSDIFRSREDAVCWLTQS